ncbi:MAG: alpha/beta hydrolase [Clostridia bacterium]|nr:alpha/beta hydrolase [Clostridia bacterium]MBQ3849052.1 alpha/beta hydrolase [Clostridia bacterium]MBR3459186.1 alpha/beta hydrolase [Clostridia bacterium]MBR5714591.1 alpha/beta hydrolase [Clostridia bacterium]MBR5717952.1 alpha/beta hydrolase [Clostridia bacterium]
MPKAVINDQYINYEIAGVRDFKLRTPALLLHGNGESMKVFAGLVSILASSRGFVLMDSRYQGGSSPAVEGLVPHISYELMADDALKLMEDELGIGEYDIIGYSDGAITAMLMALRSIHVRKLILIGVNSDPSGLKPKTVRAIKKSMSDAQHRKKRIRYELCRMMLEEPKLTKNDLASIICETTVVYGQKDDAIKREHSSQIADAIPHGSFVEIKNAGHEIPITHYKELSELVRSLL